MSRSQEDYTEVTRNKHFIMCKSEENCHEQLLLRSGEKKTFLGRLSFMFSRAFS